MVCYNVLEITILINHCLTRMMGNFNAVTKVEATEDEMYLLKRYQTQQGFIGIFINSLVNKF